ncbi:hypothetical protein SNL152K_3563 [Streptomyces sp. NL15-2K]|nr:hypothetical protein SNL152K_3563 [Streptomyces sp. NL15-2K]
MHGAAGRPAVPAGSAAVGRLAVSGPVDARGERADGLEVVICTVADPRAFPRRAYVPVGTGSVRLRRVRGGGRLGGGRSASRRGGTHTPDALGHRGFLTGGRCLVT